jgi:hypothetical protein
MGLVKKDLPYGTLIIGVLSGLKLEPNTNMKDKGLSPDQVREYYLDQQRQIEEGFELIPKKLFLRHAREEDIEQIRHSLIHDLYGRLPNLKDVILKLYYPEGEYLLDYRLPIDRTLLALQLMKEGYVSINKIVFMSHDSTSAGFDGDYDHLMGPPSMYILTPDDVPKLKDLLGKLMSLDWDQNISYSIAASRFTKSYDEKPSDKLIDLYIALEALFCKKENFRKGGIIGDSCSRLIGNSDDEREEIREVLVEGYQLRNNIVHGDLEDVYRVLELSPKIEEYLRRSLLLYI